jgi:hypothetical protein
MLKTHFLVFLLLFSSVGAILAALGQFPTAGPGGLMLNKILRTCALAGWFSVAISGAAAQEIIHVYAGIVSEVDAGSQTLTVASNDGSQQIFNYTADAKSVALINKKMREGVVAVNTVKEKGLACGISGSAPSLKKSGRSSSFKTAPLLFATNRVRCGHSASDLA